MISRCLVDSEPLLSMPLPSRNYRNDNRKISQETIRPVNGLAVSSYGAGSKEPATVISHFSERINR